MEANKKFSKTDETLRNLGGGGESPTLAGFLTDKDLILKPFDDITIRRKLREEVTRSFDDESTLGGEGY